MLVREAATADIEACQQIITGLPDFFTDDVPHQIAHDFATQRAWVIVDDDIVGFTIVDIRPPSAAEILWMAVRSNRRNSGCGTNLLTRVLDELRATGIAIVEAKTLDATASYEPYTATRKFWENNGFVQIDTIDPLPGWQPGNPSAIYICALTPTR